MRSISASIGRGVRTTAATIVARQFRGARIAFRFGEVALQDRPSRCAGRTPPRRPPTAPAAAPPVATEPGPPGRRGLDVRAAGLGRPARLAGLVRLRRHRPRPSPRRARRPSRRSTVAATVDRTSAASGPSAWPGRATHARRGRRPCRRARGRGPASRRSSVRHGGPAAADAEDARAPRARRARPSRDDDLAPDGQPRAWAGLVGHAAASG